MIFLKVGGIGHGGISSHAAFHLRLSAFICG